MGYTQKVVVIGAGISGLACAFRLKQLGVHCLVLEGQDRAGGVIATIRRNGFLFETGPQCPRFPAHLARLVHELNLASEVVAGDRNAKRYIFRNGRMHRAPFSPWALLATGLLGLPAKVRLLSEAFRSSHPPLEEESLADFVQRKFGTEVLDNLVDPFISTIFFGDPHKMGMESAFPALVQWERKEGSVLRGAIRARRSKGDAENALPVGSESNGKRSSWHVTDALPLLGSFRSGMGRLPERLAEVLGEQIRFGIGITSVAPHGDGHGGNHRWQIALSNGDQIVTEHVVLALPAYAAAEVLANSVPQLASRLGAIEYAAVGTVSFAYDRSQVAHALDGFGFMVPRREGLHTICTFWNSSLFPRRGPEGKVVMTSFAGPTAPGEAQSETPPGKEEYARQVQAENARVLGIVGEPVDRVVWHDTRALPQYNVGHVRRVREIYEMLATLFNLYLAGNFLTGRSVGDCVQIADRVAEDLRSRVSV